MKIVGLTGSIGMGKSTVAAMLRDLGVPVFDVDGYIHEIYRPGGVAVAPIAARFPTAIVDGAVDRGALSKLVIGDAAALKDLERIVHPLVRQGEAAFLDQARASGADIAVLDVPLLFETGGEGRCAATMVVSAPAAAQRARVLARPGMSVEKFEAILAKQMPDADKRARATHVIDTGVAPDETRAQLRAVVAALAAP